MYIIPVDEYGAQTTSTTDIPKSKDMIGVGTLESQIFTMLFLIILKYYINVLTYSIISNFERKNFIITGPICTSRNECPRMIFIPSHLIDCQ